ncbi:hypothetical protein [Micromonospora sp. NPDC005979]|uniref:hypothetical protein n=1 Tax=Micromonospora sp. NPDC005979 TaxID=3156726 RepID=UPI0033AA568E
MKAQREAAQMGKRKKRTREEWEAFKDVLNKFYEDETKRLTVVPKQTHVAYSNGIQVNLGDDLRRWRREGVPRGCPEDIKKLMEEYGAIGDWSIAVAASQIGRGRSKTSAEWRAFKIALTRFYEDEGKRFTVVPAKSYTQVVDGIEVRLGRNLSDYRDPRCGVPRDCPEDIMKLMEEYGAIGDWGRAIAASQHPGAVYQARERVRMAASGGALAEPSEHLSSVAGMHMRSSYGSDPAPPENYYGDGTYSTQNPAELPARSATPIGYTRQYPGTQWENFQPISMDATTLTTTNPPCEPTGNAAMYTHSYGEGSAQSESYYDGGTYSTQNPAELPARSATPIGYTRQYPGTQWENFQPIDMGVAYLTTTNPPGPDAYDNGGNPPPTNYSWRPGTRRPPRP